MILLFIRHGKTKGNIEKRYIGSTDDPILAEETDHLTEVRNHLQKLKDSYLVPDAIYSSPMLRCRQTAEILFPGQRYDIIPDFREMDFGRFEYKNYEELNGDPDYQRWIDSGGTISFPGGESREEFEDRTCSAFADIIRNCREYNRKTIALTVHGGTIMSLLHRFGYPKRDYFDWQTENGTGFILNTEGSDPERIRLIYHESIR